MNKIIRIFLDLDGTLLCGKKRHYFCYKKIASNMGISTVHIDEYWENKRAKVSINKILGSSSTNNYAEKFIAEWSRLIESPESLELDELQEGVLDLLSEWKERDIELILVTMRQDAKALESQLEKLGLRKYLDAVLATGQNGGAKNKALHVENYFKHKPFFREGSLWIGDTEVDWEAANYLELDLLLVENGQRNKGYLAGLGGATVIPTIGDANKVIKYLK